MKTLLAFVAALLALPLVIADRVLRVFGDDDSFAACSQLLSLFPGRSGSYLRVAFCRMSMASCAPDCFIGFGTVFAQRQTRIGSGVYIGPQCNIGSCEIEADVLLGSGVHIMSGTDQHHFEALDVPIREQGGRYEQIVIGADSWIGNGAMIMARIGRQTIVGAGSVVTRPTPPCSIVLGNPARVVRSRVAGAPGSEGDIPAPGAGPYE